MNGISDWFENNWIDLARLLVQLAIFAAVVRYGRKLLATLRASQEQVGALLRLSVSDAVSDAVAQQAAPASMLAAVSEPQPESQSEPQAELRTHFEHNLEPPRSYEPASVRFAPPEPAMEPEAEPVFAGFARASHSVERDQSPGGRLVGTKPPRFAAQVADASKQGPVNSPPASTFATTTAGAQGASLTPWVSAPIVAPGIEAERVSTHATPVAARAGVASWMQAPIRRSGGNPFRKMVRWLQAPVRG